MPSTSDLIRAMRLTDAATLDFFVTFSRFEFAMIDAGFARTRQNGSVEASWALLTEKLESLPSASVSSALETGMYLCDLPPKRLVRNNGVVAYLPVTRNDQSDIRFLIEGVKRARNNLFHGGKYRLSPEDPERNARIVACCDGVIRRLLDVPQLHGIRDAFNDVPM